jgi:hypothetical protein
MVKTNRKLSNALEGALAGGGDPATSPLYVFGPFLKLIVLAGVAKITFGTSVWLAVLTIIIVSGVYRLVMRWITDGSGGSGLDEEEFGQWALKIDASIGFVEYTLTFLVSMSAMVTFLADRFPVFNEGLFGIQFRTLFAISVSWLIAWLVNRGPKTASKVFGPATAGVLLLLWIMIFAVLWKHGLQLPDFQLAAFSPEYINLTLGGFARILAVMTGIEVFANMVAAYQGPPAERSRKAFGSLVIIMGTTIMTMLIVGPAIYQLSDPMNGEVSVFTQTMDALLPQPLSYVGSIAGVAVLLSACAASALGLQNLALGLSQRHYLPASIGQCNKFEVADKPVWIQVAVCSLVFLLVGTDEEAYLAIYAAGVFVMLSMTAWATTKRLLRNWRKSISLKGTLRVVGVILAALMTSLATAIIFVERLFDGVWIYFLFIPTLFLVFTYFHKKIVGKRPADKSVIMS